MSLKFFRAGESLDSCLFCNLSVISRHYLFFFCLSLLIPVRKKRRRKGKMKGRRGRGKRRKRGRSKRRRWQFKTGPFQSWKATWFVVGLLGKAILKSPTMHR